MRSWVPAALVAGILVACASTPALDYAPDTGAPENGDSGAKDAAVIQPTDDAPSGDGAPDVDVADTGIDDAADDAPKRPCPSVVAPGVGCCPGPDRTCVDQSCMNCGDCKQAGCGPKQFCCAVFNGNGKYKNTVCKETQAC